PANTLTLTFTNKAAGEMRERALKLLDNKEIYPPLLCTFHKFGLCF
ncbi:DNA helicase, UvrD/REP type, partial [sediment metagenome]